MRKPLLLLVDDDPAVLHALEAALAPGFEEILRIETFGDPEEVVASIPRWNEEKRPIAVSIIDQKMPGRTGVDLVAHLRDDEIAAHMKSIVLTGYAGLDSAMASKNEAGVERYLEKPWDTKALQREVALLAWRWLEETGRDVHFVFREVVEEKEVREHLSLRYRIYEMTSTMRHIVLHQRGFDIDPFDRAARFFSLFLVRGGSSEPVGTLRLAGEEAGPAAAAVEAIAAHDEVLAARLREPRDFLPLLEYLIDRPAVIDLIEDAHGRGEKVVEPGRLTLKPDLRKTGRALASGPMPGIPGLARHIIESAVSFFFFFGFEHAVLTCIVPHVRFYTPYGFADAVGTRRHQYDSFGTIMACLHGSGGRVPEPARSRSLSLARRIETKGLTCTCPAFPECLPGPYESGDFRGVDLLCPLRAAEVLDGDGSGSGLETHLTESRSTSPAEARIE